MGRALYQPNAAVQVLSSDDILELPQVLFGWSIRVGELFQ